MMAEMWYDRLLFSQASALSSEDKYSRKNYRMAWMVFAATLTVPLVPFALIAMWRIARRFLVGSASEVGSESSEVGGIARQDSISMPGALLLPPVRLLNENKESAADGNLRRFSQKPLHGRPDSRCRGECV